MWWRDTPVQPAAEVASIMHVVTGATQRCPLPHRPHTCRIPLYSQTMIAVPSRPTPTIDTWTAEHLTGTMTQHFERWVGTSIWWG